MTKLKSINPYSCEVLKEFDELDEHSLNQKLDIADKAFLKWKKTSFEERSKFMSNCAVLLLKNKEKYAKIITLEMGKPYVQSIAEVEKSSWACSYYADNAKEFLKDELIASDASQSYVAHNPIGVVLAIMPWNFPFWQVFRFVAPALMAGNVGLLKHASNVCQCSIAIEEVLREAGFPEGVFQSLLIGSSKVNKLIENPIVKAVTLTGSEKAGSEVAKAAGENIKKTVLELGGSDSFIVLKDADINAAVEVAVGSRMINNGQSCIAAKRFIVQEDVYDEFLLKFKERLSKYIMGDPMEMAVSLGPLARPDLVEDLDKQVKDSIAQGAKLYYQLPNPLGKAFYSPAILVDVKPGMRAYSEELFGPVATVFKVKDEQEAVKIANDTKFGLGGSIWTGDQQKGARMAREIEAGAVFINGLVKSDPRLPFGGVKASGYGRELSYLGIKEFMNQKTIWVK